MPALLSLPLRLRRLCAAGGLESCRLIALHSLADGFQTESDSAESTLVWLLPQFAATF